MTTTIALITLMTISTYTDIKENKIKNKVLLVFIMLGLIYQIYSTGRFFPTNALLGFLIPLLLLPFLSLNMLGAGDIKLFMTIGIWVGWRGVINLMVYSSLMGAIIALILIIMRKNGMKRLKYVYTYFISSFITLSVLPYQKFDDGNKDGRFPYAMAILLGYITTKII